MFRGNLDDYPKAGCGFERVVLSHSKVIVLISRNMDSLYVCVCVCVVSVEGRSDYCCATSGSIRNNVNYKLPDSWT